MERTETVIAKKANYSTDYIMIGSTMTNKTVVDNVEITTANDTKITLSLEDSKKFDIGDNIIIAINGGN